MAIVDFTQAKHVYLVCGRTDMRRGIDGLADIITTNYGLDLFDESLFLFCGGRRDRYKALYWDGDGFFLLYKRLENGKLQWPRSDQEVRQLSDQQIRWLLEGLALQQPRALKAVEPGFVS